MALTAAQVAEHYRAGHTAPSGGSTATFVYDGDGELVAKQVDGTTVARYVAGGLYEVNPATGATKTSYRFGDRLVAVRDSATGLHYLHQDHLGSTSLQTSPSGAVEGSQFRGPFGQPWLSSGSLATDFQYTGQRSFESGVAGAAGGLGSLVDYGSRWYSPVLGRFLQPDSIVPGAADPQNLNRYSYVRNNPVRYTDPTGHTIGIGLGDDQFGTGWLIGAGAAFTASYIAARMLIEDPQGFRAVYGPDFSFIDAYRIEHDFAPSRAAAPEPGQRPLLQEAKEEPVGDVPQGLSGEQFDQLSRKVREAAEAKGYGADIAVHGSRALLLGRTATSTSRSG